MTPMTETGAENAQESTSRLTAGVAQGEHVVVTRRWVAHGLA